MGITGKFFAENQEVGKKISAAERAIVRIFAGSSFLCVLIVLITVFSGIAGTLSPTVLAIYCVMLLWALVVTFHAFYSLLVFTKQVKEDLSRKSFLDELTGVFNFRYLHQRFDEEYERVRRYGGSTAMLFLDLDHFKEVNDRYGHQLGNDVLREVALAMKRQVRSSDILGRIGGDEFLVIMPESGRQQAGVLADRLRSTVENYRLEVDEKDIVDFVRVSVGVAVYPENSDSMEGVIMAADRAVYRAKDQGGNAVFAAQEFISAPDVPEGRLRAREGKAPAGKQASGSQPH